MTTREWIKWIRETQPPVGRVCYAVPPELFERMAQAVEQAKDADDVDS